jgi:hypothetical protein
MYLLYEMWRKDGKSSCQADSWWKKRRKKAHRCGKTTRVGEFLTSKWEKKKVC